MTALSVNLNKIAVLRNSRGGSEPSVLRAGIACLDAGAHGLTVHPRPDARHIREDDVRAVFFVTFARCLSISSAIAKSSGKVTLMLRVSPSTSLGLRPRPSIARASSVTVAGSAARSASISSR